MVNKIDDVNLVRVWYPGIQLSDGIASLGSATFSSKIVQDIVDEGMLYTIKGLGGIDMVCFCGNYENLHLALITSGMSPQTVVPVEIPLVDFVGPRPTTGPKGHGR